MINWSDYFYYDETSPSGLRRSKDVWCGRYHNVLIVNKGQVAGCNTGKYWLVSFNNKKYLTHTIIWSILRGEIPKDMYIDHIDGNGHNNLIDNLRLVTRIGNARNCKKRTNNNSGVVGVNFKVNTRSNGNSNQYWVASWRDLLGKRREKNFSVTKLGYDEAFRLACEYREKMILALNAQGAGYTERHGK